MYSETSDPPKKDNLHTNDNPSIHTPYKMSSERGQPLYKGQKAGSQACPEVSL